MSWTGGCLCGVVRYRLASAPQETGWCHCRLCQQASGAPAMVFSTVSLADYLVETGADGIGRVDSSGFGWRHFCRACGTPLSMRVTHEPDTIDVATATLDDPAAAVPGFHIFYDSRIAWAPAADSLPRHARSRPGTERPGE